MPDDAQVTHPFGHRFAPRRLGAFVDATESHVAHRDTLGRVSPMIRRRGHRGDRPGAFGRVFAANANDSGHSLSLRRARHCIRDPYRGDPQCLSNCWLRAESGCCILRARRAVGTGGVGMVYDRPAVNDFGSIADHTFSRCNPEAPSLIPPKDTDQVPHHIDNHQECSALS